MSTSDLPESLLALLDADARSLLTTYRQTVENALQEVAAELTARHGPLTGQIQLMDESVHTIDWHMMLTLLSMVGAQTLTIRGSEKSTYGKLFERLVVGTLLEMLGFDYTGRSGQVNLRREFWLSSRDDRRESDATLLWEAGVGARIDIGFIGRGNPEITLDKMSRFAREIELQRARYYMATIIIVDRVGVNSRIADHAARLDADVVQMSASYWPRQVAQILHHRLPGFDHPLVTLPRERVADYLATAVKTVALERFL